MFHKDVSHLLIREISMEYCGLITKFKIVHNVCKLVSPHTKWHRACNAMF